ncbi:MAG: RNA polymerase sigma-70 factor [Bacteroidia bacterium]
MSPTDEHALLQQIALHDDHQAFGVLVEHYSARLTSYAQTFVRQSVLAEEVVSDVWVKFWRNRLYAAEIAHLSAYLFRAVRHQSLNTRARDARKAPVETDAWAETLADPAPADTLAFDELRQILDRAVAQLPTGSREAFVLVRQDGLSYQEAADRLGISVNTLKTQLGRALKRLREELGRYLISCLLLI